MSKPQPHFGQFVRDSLHNRNLSIKQAAELADLSVGTISGLMRMKKPTGLHPKTRDKLNKFLGQRLLAPYFTAPTSEFPGTPQSNNGNHGGGKAVPHFGDEGDVTYIHNLTQYDDSFAVRMRGDSMGSVVREGTDVWASPSAPQSDGMVAVVQFKNSDELLIIQVFDERLGYVKLVPGNLNREKYPIKIVSMDEIAQISRVFGRLVPM